MNEKNCSSMIVRTCFTVSKLTLWKLVLNTLSHALTVNYTVIYSVKYICIVLIQSISTLSDEIFSDTTYIL